MLHHYQAKSVDDIYLDDFPNIIHPNTAARYLEETARPNRIIREWDLPGNYGLFVSRYRQFHFQQPWMAYRDVLDDIRSGKVVLLGNDAIGHVITGVQTSSGNLRHDLPLFLHSRLSYLISHQLKRPVYCVLRSAPIQHAQSTKPSTAKQRVGFWPLGAFTTAILRDSGRPQSNSAGMHQRVTNRSWITRGYLSPVHLLLPG